ncbi:ATP-binding protein [Blastococcus sp. KM273129]|uniref:ATP-binding protein n=1 Tax=Blastococcus sp. KM273129 TaxID=2570315 RepID=UPI001F425330|nr:ATP-binding protein [Blastococcus sp. KM273129]MCF6733633.1 ATP-binding protein [Blastococcus sp. KM273129]
MPRRRLSGMPETVVNTPSLLEGIDTAATVLDTQAIGLFDGPVGTGKTTTAEWVASQQQAPTINLVMPPRPAKLTALRKIVRALTGDVYDASGDALEDAAIDLLRDWNGLLIVDEVQTIGGQGISELRYIHDVTRESFGLLLVGNGVEAAIRTQPALDDRILVRAHFQRLTGEDLITVLHDLDPRLKRTAAGILARLDQRHCRGRLRDWSQILLLLDTDYPEATRISGALADELLLRVDRHEIIDATDQDVA